MLKLSSISFTGAAFCRSSFMFVFRYKRLQPGLYPVTWGWCVWFGGWVGDQGVITIQTSTMTPLSATVSRVLTDGAVVTNAFHSYNACLYMRALNNNGNEHRR